MCLSMLVSLVSIDRPVAPWNHWRSFTEIAPLCVPESKVPAIKLFNKVLFKRTNLSSVSSRTHRWLIYCERRIGSSMARWHRQRVPNWIASGVILTCSVTVKSQMFWFILSPLSIRSFLFSAVEGFSTEGLAKAGSVYTVHLGRKWRRDKNLLTHGIPTSEIHPWAYAHLFSYVHTYSSIAQIFVPAFLLQKWLFALTQHLLIRCCVIKAAEEADADA